MRALHAAGSVVLGGPFADDCGGIVVVEAESRDAAHAMLQRDPAIETGVMLGDVHPWLIMAGTAARAAGIEAPWNATDVRS